MNGAHSSEFLGFYRFSASFLNWSQLYHVKNLSSFKFREYLRFDPSELKGQKHVQSMYIYLLDNYFAFLQSLKKKEKHAEKVA